MFNLSQNYYARKCYLEREQVPTQSVIKKIMSPPLADVYFKSMGPKLKVIAGFEPPLKGGGSNWYVPPADILEGRYVMKPINSKDLSNLSCYGIDEIGMKLIIVHRNRMKAERKRIMAEDTDRWQKTVKKICDEEEARLSAVAAKINSAKIQHLFNEFCTLFANSINKFQELSFNAAVDKIKLYREEAFSKMQAHYEHLLQQQSNMLYDRYTNKLNATKETLKKKFIEELEIHRTEFGNKLHDIYVEKHVAVEKLRHYLECQTLACQVYVALKERDEYTKEVDIAKFKHKRQMKDLTGKVMYTALEVHLAKLKEMKVIEIDTIWKKKVCHVVKTFQTFVLYCLKMIPEYAEFFINMEKLLLLQLNNAIDKPTCCSIIEDDFEFNTPIPQPKPFYLFCNRGTHATIDSKLCPKHVTSSASQMPVIVINKRCIYAACDNFELFSDKVKDYINREHEVDLVDEHDYTGDRNVTYTDSQQLREMKLQGSLLQVLQQEIANLSGVTFQCKCCKVPHCFCADYILSKKPAQKILEIEAKPPQYENRSLTRLQELEHERGPKFDSFFKYIEPRKCNCTKQIKKHVIEHLPTYMKTVSTFERSTMASYEKCPVKKLKKLVKIAQGRKDPVVPVKEPSKTKDISIQCSDYEFENICDCLSDMSIDYFLETLKSVNELQAGKRFHVVDGSVSEAYVSNRMRSFAQDRANSLRRLIDESPEVIKIFERK